LLASLVLLAFLLSLSSLLFLALLSGKAPVGIKIREPTKLFRKKRQTARIK
jgi:hypothetical protein